jgi:hypothetical protein
MRNIEKNKQTHSFNIGDVIIFNGNQYEIQAKLIPGFYLVENDTGFKLSKQENMIYKLDENKKYLIVQEKE